MGGCCSVSFLRGCVKAFCKFSLLGVFLLVALPVQAQPSVPKKAPVPPRIVPGSGNTAPERINPDTGPQKIDITPSTPIQQPLNPAPFKIADNAKIDLAAVNEKPVTNRFVMALCADKSGRLWIGTEDEGVWRYDEKAPVSSRWKQFTTKDGLGDDNAYAIACDQQGRIWVGHLNQGVSVYNGERWKNYDVLNGPLGERIFDIAIAPNDGSVWMATSAGLTRYSPNKDDWTYYTRAEGLPSDQIAALAFNNKGNLFAGTQCDGLAIARAADDYRTWQSVRGPERMPNTPLGEGLPSNLINDVLVTKDQSIYVATTCGLARSFDNGATWKYIRGADWESKVKGLYKGPEPKQMTLSNDLLLEDYSTCLAEGAKGQIWVGHWRRGCEVRANKGEQRVAIGTQPFGDSADYVRAVLPTPERSYMGLYGAGALSTKDEKRDAEFQLPLSIMSNRPNLLQPIKLAIPTKVNPIFIQPVTQSNSIQSNAKVATKEAISPPLSTTLKIDGQSVELENQKLTKFPSPATPPTVTDLQLATKQAKSLYRPLVLSKGVYLGEDWRTQGNWFGRYGRQHTVLCAAGSPFDHQVVSDSTYKVTGEIGSHHSKGDGLRSWVHWIKTDNSKVLYNPVIGYRRQADWDDHGEAYSTSYEGPDIWISVTVPEGVHRISLYFFNKDGHDGANRCRDYSVELKAYKPATQETETLASLACTRVRDFWGPVYKQFVVRGPAKYCIKIQRNGSLNTIVQSVMLDKLAGPISSVDTIPLPKTGNLGYNAPFINLVSAWDVPSARELWAALNESYGKEKACEISWHYRILAYRAALAGEGSEEMLSNWRWTLSLWSSEEREAFKSDMARLWAAHLKLNPNLKNVQM